MNLFHAFILGVVEGITEFLPISSTGHLILVSQLLGIPQTEFVKSFEIIIQLGAILAVVVLYGGKLIKDHDLFKKVLVAFIPTGILGLLLYKFVKTYLLGDVGITLLSLLIGGIALIMIEKFMIKQKTEDKDLKTNDITKPYTLSYLNAVVVGLFQSLSMIPGTSRSAASIIGGIAVGMDRVRAVEFSFLLAIPTMLAATGYDFAKSYKVILSEGNFLVLIVGFVTSFVVAYIVIKWFLRFVQHHTLTAFGVYRIILSILYFFFIHT